MISRSSALEALSRGRFDVLVIGGGITGAGIALDAAARGYSVAIVEKADWASGTSSRSSKLVHGGLRYLQRFDLGLVREALLERALLVRLAPHLVTPLPMVVPAFDGQRPDRLIGIGLNLYDVMATPPLRSRRAARRALQDGAPGGAAWSPERHRTISGAEVASLIPALAPRRPTSGYLFYDCQTDDARLVLTVLGEAERFGAVGCNRLEALALTTAHGRADGVRARDALSGEELQISARSVVNATGVWADRLRPAELHDEAELPRIVPSRGSHILLTRSRLPVSAGVIVPAGEGRSAFVVPWLGHSLVGTTDNVYEGEIDHVRPSQEDRDYLLRAVNDFFATELTVADVSGTYAGVRPLISSGESRKSVDISRRAEIYETSSGLVTITGGKLTTWRRMAKMAVDRLVERDARHAPCRTHEIPLGRPVAAGELPRVRGVAGIAYGRLAARYGQSAEHVLEIAAAQPELAAPILPGEPDLLAEVVHAARSEQAQSVGDVLLRRTRLGLLRGRELCQAEADGPRRVGGALAAELGWTAAELEGALAAFAAEAAAEGIAVGSAEMASVSPA